MSWVDRHAVFVPWIAGMCWLIPLLEVQNHLKNEIEHSLRCPAFACFSDGSWSWVCSMSLIVCDFGRDWLVASISNHSNVWHKQLIARLPTISGISPLDMAESTEHINRAESSQGSYTNLHSLKTCFDWHIRNGALLGLNGVQIQCLS